MSNIGNRKRWRILVRDKFRCVYCGRTAKDDDVRLEVDHATAVANGGGNEDRNLVTACYDCNRGKRDDGCYACGSVTCPGADEENPVKCPEVVAWQAARIAAGEPIE